MKEELRVSLTNYHSVVEHSPNAVLVHQDYKIIYANPAALRMFDAGELSLLINKSLFDFIHPDFHELVKQRVEHMINSGLNAPMTEMQFLKLGNITIDVEVQGTSIVFEGEKAIHVALRDISKRKVAEESLRKSEEKFAKVFSTSPVAISIAELSTGKYIDVNTAFLKKMGYKKEEVIGFTSTELNV